MKLAVLDPGYEHMHSHHHAVNVGIHNAFFQKNALVTFFGGYLLDQDTLKSAFGDGLDGHNSFHERRETPSRTSP